MRCFFFPPQWLQVEYFAFKDVYFFLNCKLVSQIAKCNSLLSLFSLNTIIPLSPGSHYGSVPFMTGGMLSLD